MKMRRVMRTGRDFLQAILEVLIELDRRTDISKRMLDMVKLQDEESDEEYPDSHFGVVSIALTLAALPTLTEGLSLLILLLQ